MIANPLVSICILSYNRPETIKRLFKTINLISAKEIEVLVCEDFSPRRKEIEKVVQDYSKLTAFPVRYFSNKKNLGFDGTFNRLVDLSIGKWLVFMGDDDEFVEGALDIYINFLKKNPDLGYVMKSHYLIHENNKKELFKYFPTSKYFEPGLDSYISLFRKSVYIAGFTIRRDCILPYLTDRFDGTMLIQIYLLAEVVLKFRSAYLDVPFTQQYASHKHNIGDVMYDRDNLKFIPRKPTLDISINFLNSFSKITEYMDSRYGFQSTPAIKKDMSKYFYPSLAVHRDSGVKFFLEYVKSLNKLGFNCTVYYYIYVVALIFLGKKFCDSFIFLLKRLIGRTPNL